MAAMSTTMIEIPDELLAAGPDGLPKVSRYNEFLRITNQEDTPDTFVQWSQVAYTLMHHGWRQ